MKKIKQLSLHEAQKIAAGEVVERPGNVVKELIENSIDAGATNISIYVHQGGQALIRITDNGCGMSLEDAQICFDHHATSKINSVQDLPTLQSFGFRGEALASISAVSHVTLITKEADAESGIKIERSQSSIHKIEEISCTSGTDITIKDLFFNVPARKKFLKSAQTEMRHITQLFHAFCFDYHTIHFSLFSENKLVYNCPSVTSFAERAAQVWDETATRNLIDITYTQKNIVIAGAISNHQYYRYDRNYLYFFVNKRWIKNQQLAKAILKGYLNVIPQARFPAGIISLTVDPQEVDINIHPRKQEVQFLHPRIIEQTLQECVKKSLEQDLSAKIKKPVQFLPVEENTFSARSHLQSPNFSTATFDNEPQQITFPKPKIEPPLETHTIISNMIQSPAIENNNEKQLQSSQQESYRLLCQYKKTYILIERAEGLFIIDQHAAHERILYEQFRSRFGNMQTIQLIFPQIISLSETEYQTIHEQFTLLEQHGIGIEVFGQNQVIIQSTPVHLKNCSMQEIIKEIIGLIEEHKPISKEEFSKVLHERVHAQMACKAAVKAGDELTHEKMQQLLHDLYKTENRFACPHGRPTSWLLSLDELERKFKRKK